MRSVFTVVLSSILETALIGFTEQRIKRFVLARANVYTTETERHNPLHSFDWIFRIARISQKFGRL